MAAKTDSDESFEEILDEKDDYVTEVIKDVLLEASNEVRLHPKDFKNSENQEIDQDNGTECCTVSQPQVTLDSNSHNIDGVRCHEYKIDIEKCCTQNDKIGEALDENVHVLRKSQSDDVLSTHSPPKENIRTTYSGTDNQDNDNVKTIPKMCEEYRDELNEYDGDELDNNQDDEEDDDIEDEANFETGSVDFFREYDKKIDILECCDYALEESFIRLKEHIEILLNAEVDKRDKETVEQQTTEDEASSDVQQKDEADTDDVKTQKSKQTEYFINLNQAMIELQGRFERFITEVGETIQLGALAAKHSQRVEKWAGEIQSTYGILKNDHQKLQCYIDVKEREWIRAREELQAEISYHGEQIQDLIDGVKKNEDLKNKTEKLLYKKIGDRMVKRPVNPDKSSTEESLIDFLAQKRYEEEQAIALDFSRRMKISELKLVILQQQSYIQKIELQNKELDGILRGLLYNPDNETEEEQEKGYDLKYSDPVSEKVSQVSEVIQCDQAVYLPGRSTDPDIVAAQVFNIGDGCPGTKVETESPFDPTKLHYIQTFTADQVRKDNVTEEGDQPNVTPVAKPEQAKSDGNAESVTVEQNMPCFTGQSGEPNGLEHQVKSLSVQSQDVLEHTSTEISAN